MEMMMDFIGKAYLEKSKADEDLIKNLQENQHLYVIIIPDGDQRANLIFDLIGNPMGQIGA